MLHEGHDRGDGRSLLLGDAVLLEGPVGPQVGHGLHYLHVDGQGLPLELLPEGVEEGDVGGVEDFVPDGVLLP